MISLIQVTYFPSRFVNICYAGNEIPGWFNYQSMEASITIELPLYWHNAKFLGFALCAVVAFHDCHCRRFKVQCKCHFQNNYGDCSDLICDWNGWTGESEEARIVQSEHVLLWYYHRATSATEMCNSFTERAYNKATFEFYPLSNSCNYTIKCCQVKKCGVVLLYVQDKMPEEEVEKRKRINPVEEARENKRCRDDHQE